MMKPRVLFAVCAEKYLKVFGGRDLDRIRGFCEVIESPVPELADKEFLLKYVGDAEIVISSWDTACLDLDVVSAAVKLKLLAHAAGSVRPVVSDALFDRGIKVTSSSAAIAYGVAEFCLGLILMAPKRAFWTAEAIRGGKWQDSLAVFGGPFEIYQQKIGIIGASHVGRQLIGLLKNFDCEIVLYDPYVSADQAGDLGVTKFDTLEDLFGQCKVVSLNAPSTEQTKAMIKGKHFALLPDGAVFINTARGAIIDEREMIEELKKERFVACLDVTDPEPPEADSLLRQLPNVILTPHIAGVIAENMLRLGTFVADEIEAFVGDKPFKFEVTPEQLSRIG